MHADLMRAAGLELALDARDDGRRPRADNLVGGARGTTARRHRHARAPRFRTTDRRVDDAATRGGYTPHERVVATVDGARRELRNQRLVRARRTRDDEQTARLAIESMHDAGTKP